MKQLILRAAALCAVAFLFVAVCGCHDETQTTQNQELTKQRQAKIQQHKGDTN